MELITLILALITIESNGRDLEIGDGGLAYGALQIHACYVEDANSFANESWTHEDAFDRKIAIDIFVAYMRRYANEDRLGRYATAEDIARIHNGGPLGYRKAATDDYWRKVKAELIRRGAYDLANGKVGFDL